jgi:hypothetical protein
MSEGGLTDEAREGVRTAAGNRCGYCLSPQRLVLGWLEIEHIIPKARGGTDVEQNLWLACRLCNNSKRTQIDAIDPRTGSRERLFNPRRQKWSQHFAWTSDGTRIRGQTGCGRATVTALQLNNVIAVMVRKEWVAAGWHSPADPT